jgi:hypothetical protein
VSENRDVEIRRRSEDGRRKPSAVPRPLDQPGNHQIGGDFSIRIHGTRVRHYLGPTSIKM